jgi:hypothetical protein
MRVVAPTSPGLPRTANRAPRAVAPIQCSADVGPPYMNTWPLDPRVGGSRSSANGRCPDPRLLFGVRGRQDIERLAGLFAGQLAQPLLFLLLFLRDFARAFCDTVVPCCQANLPGRSSRFRKDANRRTPPPVKKDRGIHLYHNLPHPATSDFESAPFDWPIVILLERFCCQQRDGTIQ